MKTFSDCLGQRVLGIVSDCVWFDCDNPHEFKILEVSPDGIYVNYSNKSKMDYWTKNEKTKVVCELDDKETLETNNSKISEVANHRFFDIEKYQYLESNELPCLVLAIKQNPQYPHEYNFRNNDFEFIAHQCGGLGCSQMYFQAKKLQINPIYHSQLRIIENHFSNSNVGVFGVTLTEIFEYQNFLTKIPHADCDLTFSDFKEAIYPIDLTQEVINELTTEKIDINKLDDLIIFDNDIDKMCGFINRFKLYYLTQNSD